MRVYLELTDENLEFDDWLINTGLTICRLLDEGSLEIKTGHERDLGKVVAIRMITGCSLRDARDIMRYYKQKLAQQKRLDEELQKIFEEIKQELKEE